MLGKLGPEQIERLLQQECVGRIGCHAEGRTYVVPVTYWYDGQCVIAHSAEGQKLRMMRMAPHVCFEVDRMRSMQDWESVIAYGTFEEIPAAEQAEALRSFSRWLAPRMPSTTSGVHGQGATAVLFRIRLTEKSGRFEHP